MNRRVIFGALALVLALVGGGLLLVYVQGADQRALDSLDPQPVLVVVQDVPAGLSVSELSEYVEVRDIPANAVVAGSFRAVDDLPKDQIALTSLKVGEQVLASRFVARDDNEVAASVPIPEGLQLISVQLSPERVAGAQLNAGDKVGIFASMEVEVEGVVSPTPAASPTTDGEKDERSLTGLIANDVLVARVQGAPASAQPSGDATAGSETLPGSEVIVTLAVDAPLAGKIIFTKEYGALWLTRQTPATDFSKIGVVGAWTVFE
ncbi:RcpC/CpaB family pilus assembly protein [Tessaracoccus sp. Y36]